MRISSALLLALLLLSGISCPVFAQEDQRSDVILEKMSYKLSRGIANMATCIVELPKQTFMTTRDKGGIGIIIGPMKGVGMTLYRAFTGVAETVFFLVPQPGYYNTMIEPDFVWNGWEDTRLDRLKSKEAEDAGATSFVMPVPTTTGILSSQAPKGLYDY